MNRRTAKRSAHNKFSLVAKPEVMVINELEKFCAENGVARLKTELVRKEKALAEAVALRILPKLRKCRVGKSSRI